MTSAVVFDLDGTLADTAEDISESLNAALATLELGSVDAGAARLMIGRGPTVLAELTLQHLGVVADRRRVEQLTDAFMDHYAASGNRLSSLFPGVRECLEELASLNIAIGVCSNKPHDSCRGLLVDLGVAKYVRVLQGSGDGVPKKPDPTMLLNVLRSLNAPAEQALYVGDSATDVQTAHAAGLRVILVSYGYTDKPAAQLGADRVVSSLRELSGTWPDLTTPGLAAALPPRRSTAP